MNKKSLSILMLVAIVAVAGLVAGCGGFSGGSPAKVGDVYIDGSEFAAEVDAFASQYGISEETDPDTYHLLAEDILQDMINTQLAVQKAADLGVEIADEEVQGRLDQLALTYYSGDLDALVDSLESEGMTLEQLQKQIKDYLLLNAVYDKVVEGVAEPTDEEIAAYYEENSGDFLTEETIEARHILIPVADQTVRAFTATTTTESTTTTTTESTDTSEDESTDTESTTTTTISELEWAQALALAAQLRADLLGGADWSALAALYSADLDTKDDGGYLGIVESEAFIDTLGQQFENAVLYMTLDQISEPIETDYGYEIIQVTKVNEPEQMTLEDASDDIAAILLSIAQDEAWDDFLDAARAEIGIEYSRAYQTTTTEAVTTTLESSE